MSEAAPRSAATPLRHPASGRTAPEPGTGTEQARKHPTTLDRRTRLLVESASDRTAASRELAAAWLDRAEERRISPIRANLVRLLDVPTDASVLELGAGAGAVTRYLGETCGPVDALEPDPELAAINRLRCGDLDNVRVFTGGADELPPPLPGTGYRLILWLPPARRPLRSAAQLTDLMIRLAALLTDDGHLVVATAADRASMVREALTSAGCPVEQVLRAVPDHLCTTALFLQDVPAAEAAVIEAVLDGPITGGSAVLIGRRPGASGGPLFGDLIRATEVDGRRVLAADLVVGGDGPSLVRRVHHLAAPGAVRLTGQARAWHSGPRLIDRLRDADPGSSPALLAPWAALVEAADDTDGLPATLIPHTLIESAGGWLPTGADLRVDGWSRADLLAHGLLDTALRLGSSAEQVRRTAHDLGAGFGLPAGWVVPALRRAAAVRAAVTGEDPEQVHSALESRVYGSGASSGRARAGLRALIGTGVRLGRDTVARIRNRVGA